LLFDVGVLFINIGDGDKDDEEIDDDLEYVESGEDR
jgi:hypothetical protein